MTNENENSSSDSKLKRKYVHFDDYLNTLTFLTTPISEQGIEILAQKLMAWSRDRNSLVIADFLDEMGIHHSTYYKWVNRSPLLKEAQEYAKRRVGSNREYGALVKRLDVSMVRHKQHLYDNEWDEANRYHANLRTVNLEEGQKEYIIIREAPSNPLVPEKKKRQPKKTEK